ncbi:MAG TPA: response regulator [Candidatus Polarisedimenticolia bacterium]|nr:response regulator [Candidatus Polarisedimenticolia bacterium]
MSSGTILIVDDSENIRSVLQMNFEHLGYTVLAASDGEEALRVMEREEPDVVVLDVMMPRQNGFQVCRKMKSNPRLASIPVVFLTAKGQREDRYWGKDCGADEYLTKPFSTAELERVIERLLDRDDRSMTLGQFEAELAQRRQRREPFLVLTVAFDAKALTVFRQKYGEFRFHDALEGIRQTVELIVREETGESLVWMAGDNVVKAILPGERERAAALKDRIVLQSDLLLKSFYDEQDAGRGYVVARQGPEADEIHVPLLRMEAHLAEDASTGL